VSIYSSVTWTQIQLL